MSNIFIYFVLFLPRMRLTRITITRVAYRDPDALDLNRELQLIAGSIGLFNQRDKDRSKYRIFIALLRALSTPEQTLTTDDLALGLGLSRATVIHHLGALIDAGIVVQYRGAYRLSVDSLSELVDKIQEDLDKTMAELRAVAKKADVGLRLDAHTP